MPPTLVGGAGGGRAVLRAGRSQRVVRRGLAGELAGGVQIQRAAKLRGTRMIHEYTLVSGRDRGCGGPFLVFVVYR